MPVPLPPGRKITTQRLLDATPRTIYHQAIITNTSPTITALNAETVGYTTSAIDFRAGRVYQISLKCAAQSSIAGDRVTVRLRKTALGGDVFIEVPQLTIPAVNANQLAESVVYASGTLDVSRSFVVTITKIAGTGAVFLAGSVGAYVGHITVKDVGDPTLYANTRAIT